MDGNVVTYKEVKKKAFDEVSDLCSQKGGGRNVFAEFGTVKYNGTELYGEMCISVSPGESKIYKEMLQKVAEILAKYQD